MKTVICGDNKDEWAWEEGPMRKFWTLGSVWLAGVKGDSAAIQRISEPHRFSPRLAQADPRWMEAWSPWDTSLPKACLTETWLSSPQPWILCQCYRKSGKTSSSVGWLFPVMRWWSTRQWHFVDLPLWVMCPSKGTLFLATFSTAEVEQKPDGMQLKWFWSMPSHGAAPSQGHRGIHYWKCSASRGLHQRPPRWAHDPSNSIRLHHSKCREDHVWAFRSWWSSSSYCTGREASKAVWNRVPGRTPSPIFPIFLRRKAEHPCGPGLDHDEQESPRILSEEQCMASEGWGEGWDGR